MNFNVPIRQVLKSPIYSRRRVDDVPFYLIVLLVEQAR
jgi:hypothetical protein